MSDTTRDFAPGVPDGCWEDPTATTIRERMREAHERRLADEARHAEQLRQATAEAYAAPDLAALRTTLAAALATYATAVERHQRADAALQRGHEAVAAARRDLAALGDTDSLVAAWRAGRLAAGKSADLLPDDLRHRRDEADRLRREVSDAERTSAVLDRDAQAAADEMHHADEVRRRAAVNVMFGDAHRIAAEVRAHTEAADRLRAVLAGLGMETASTGPHRLQYPRAALDAIALRTAPAPEPSASGPVSVARDRWAGYLSALLDDVDAAMEE